MPRCTLCKKLLPPIICEITEDNKAHICTFCKRETDVIWYTDNEGKRNSLSKNECIKEYDIYLKKMSEDNEAVKKMVQGKNEEKNN